MSKRAGKKEMLERAAEISGLIARNYSRYEIGLHLSTKFKVTPESIEKQYDKILQAMARENKSRMDEDRASALSILDRLINKNIENGNDKLVGELIDKRAKIAGLYAPKEQTKKDAPKIVIQERKPLSVVPKDGTNDE